MPCGLRWWLQAVGESVDASAQAPAARKYTAVANFVKTQWGQGIP
jgi:predicted ATPase